ncbi:hypothetical protein AgCh_012895 [Apium graveolens]
MLSGSNAHNVIWDNRYHVSEDVWDGAGRDELQSYSGNKSLHLWKLRRPQRELLHMLGFGIFADPVVVLATDTRLISALVECWRPETNTFFTRQGEMTVTLEDVGFILGLSVQGDALTCGVIENKAEYSANNWFEPLIEEEVKEALYRNNIKLGWLFEKYGAQKPEKNNMKAKVWSYERFPRIGMPLRSPGQEDYPVAEGWAYFSDTHTGVSKKRRMSGPHHSLPFYRGEFDGVASDEVVWRPYARFEDVMDSEMIQAQLDGCGRVPLVCYDVVEWQYPDSVSRQFGSSPQIPRAPVNMVGYMGAKDATFAGEDWLVRWFIDISKWARFCSDLDGLVDDSVDIASEADYMAWYADISRMRIGKPDPQPQQQYKMRELYDSLEGYEVMVVGLNMLKQLDARVPPEFVEEFGRISGTFLTPFSRLMKKIKGPAYRPPTFQNIKPDFIAPLPDDFDIPAIPAQDVVDMTQPSQHVYNTLQIRGAIRYGAFELVQSLVPNQ